MQFGNEIRRVTLSEGEVGVRTAERLATIIYKGWVSQRIVAWPDVHSTGVCFGAVRAR